MVKEGEGQPETGWGLIVLGAVSAALWLAVLAVLATLPFFIPFNLHHGVFPSNYGILWSSWSLLGIPVAVLNLFLLLKRRQRVLPAIALILTLGTCLVECPTSGLLYQKWEQRWLEVGWSHVKPQFDAIIQHLEKARLAQKEVPDSQGQPAGMGAEAANEPYEPDWPGIEKLNVPEWRWRGKCLIFPGQPERVVFYWPQGHMDLNRIVVYDPSGELMKIRQAGATTAEGHASLAGLFATGGFRRLTICRHLEGNYYFCEFTY